MKTCIDQDDLKRLVVAMERTATMFRISTGPEASAADCDEHCERMEAQARIERELDAAVGRLEVSAAFRWIQGVGKPYIFEIHCEIGARS